MKNLYIVANWKANKTDEESRAWLAAFKDSYQAIEEKKVIVCPTFISLATVQKIISDEAIDIRLGSQDLSRFAEGPYTGEVPYITLKNIVQYSILGHSERRQNFEEEDKILSQKVNNAIAGGIVPIFCVQGADTFIPEGVTIVAYEPIEAIGTGKPDTPEDADKVASTIKDRNSKVEVVLYGGSVNPENVTDFTGMENIDGVLVGGASLEVSSFISLINNA